MSGDAHHDDWHQHTRDEGVPQVEHGEHVSTKGLAVVGLSIVFGVVFVILVLFLYFDWYVTRVAQERQEGVAAVVADPLSRRTQAEEALRGRPAWIDRDAGTVSIPLDAAIEKVLTEYGAGESAADAATGEAIDRPATTTQAEPHTDTESDDEA